MTNWLLYLIQTSVVFICLHLLYILFFQKLTFHKVNRLLLIVIPIISLLIPLSYFIVPNLSNIVIEIPKLNDFVVNSEEAFMKSIDNSKPILFNYKLLYVIIYSVGFMIMLFKFLSSFKSIITLKNTSNFRKEGKCKLIFIKSSQTFSFFHWIFIPENKKINNNLIIEHEKAHATLYHSLDIIFFEIYIMFFWFNPFVYVYRKSLISIHEYQADAHVLKQNIKTSKYLKLLWENLEPQTSSNNLYSYFNQSIIKRRINMMTKKSTKKVYKLAYIFFVISSVLLSIAFIKPTSTKPSLFPVKNKSKNDIVLEYGKVVNGKKHNGIDIKAPKGTPVICTADGIIVKVSDEKSWGKIIIINHNEGYQTRYAHLSIFNVKERQPIKKGDIIGFVGSTGLANKPHLHYEILKNNQQQNPLNYIVE